MRELARLFGAAFADERIGRNGCTGRSGFHHNGTTDTMDTTEIKKMKPPMNADRRR
jgi:hypothetical protein